jgi:integrase
LQREERGRLVDTITTEAIDDYRAELLASDLSQRTAQKVLVLHGEPQKPLVFHDLRHSFCTWAVNVFTLPEVKELAGHRDITTTMK